MRLFGVRQLDEYPHGLRRLWLLAMAVLAVLIGSYEAQIAPVIPLLVRDLDIDLETYGTVTAVAAVVGAVAAFVGGRLTDHLGRVRLLVPLMMVTALCCFAMTLVDSTRELLLARTVLAFVDGMALASTAPLVRDFSPRKGRAQAFGFWTWGPVGASLLAAALAAWTLPIFANSWRSQFILMGLISLVMSLVIAGTIADLSPELRARIQHSERTALPARHRAGAARARDLLAHRRLWAHGVGISLWLVLYLSLATYGPTMLVDIFELSSAQAAGIMTAFWGVDLVVLVVVGRISDRLQLRKPFALGGTLAAAVAAGYLLVLMGRSSVPAGQLMAAGALLGAALAVAYGPWMANYSEDAEDVDPRLQGTAWGIFGFLSRTTAVVVVLAVPRIVAVTSWQAWLSIAMACLVLFVPAVFLFGGPWRPARRPGEVAARVAPARLTPAGPARLTPVAGGPRPEPAGTPARV